VRSSVKKTRSSLQGRKVKRMSERMNNKKEEREEEKEINQEMPYTILKTVSVVTQKLL
jgi:hypothetical protein